mgnify:CR=1 FL=1
MSQLSNELTEKKIFDLLDHRYSKSYILYEHLHNSYNECCNNIINYLKTNDNTFNESRIGDILYRNRLKYENIVVVPPTTENGKKLMYPSDARNRNITYSIRFMAKITQIQELYDLNLKETIKTKVIGVNERDEALSLPVMVRSKYCSLEVNKKNSHKYECKLDPGGYFIVNGSEKIILSIERMIENKPLVFAKKDGDSSVFTVTINSKSLNTNIMMQGIHITLKKNNDMMLRVPIFNELSVFVLMRGLGLETDKEIMEYVLYDKNDIDMMNILKIAIDISKKDGKKLILSKDDAIQMLINKLKVNKKFTDKSEKLNYDEKKDHLESLLKTIFMPHISPDKHNDVLKTKAINLGLMVNKLLNCYLGRIQPDDRDSFINKRVDMAGDMIFDLVKQNHNKVLKDVNNKVFKKRADTNHIKPLNITHQLKPSTIKQNIDSAIALGMLGKKVGASQVYPRLTPLQSLSYLRRVNTPSSDSSMTKLTGPRHFHSSQFGMLCVTGDTEVLMADGTVKLIKDMQNGDSVVTVSKDDLSETYSKIKNWFCRSCDKLLEITTESGRSIKCTPDHKFMVYENNKYIMKEIEKMNVGDNLIIKHYPKYIARDKNTVFILNTDTISKTYKKRLEEAGYKSGEQISEDKLEILARLVGLNITDGHLCFRDKHKSYECSFSVGEQRDVEELKYDIEKLGFGIANSRTCKNNFKNGIEKREIVYNTYEVSKFGAFPCLLNLLGAFCGKKTTQKRKIPEWIMNGSNRVKREFINGFISGDGCKISINKRLLAETGDIGQATTPECLNETNTYMNNISLLLKELGVECKSGNYDKINEYGKQNCYVRISCTFENCDKYSDVINYRYCNEKRKKSAIAIEYIKYRNQFGKKITDNENKRKEIEDNIFKHFNDGKSRTDIFKLDEYGLKQAKINKIIRNKINNVTLTPEKNKNTYKNEGCMSYDDFKKQTYINNDNLFSKIISIKVIASENVYDFETESDNHTLIGNWFVQSNCSVETPEHASVGQTKHLTMTSSITCPSSKQANVVYNMIKDNNKFTHLDNHSPLKLSKCTKILLNGDWIGITEKGYDLYQELYDLKLNNVINKLNSIVYDIPNMEIRILTESGRLYRPVLTVKNNKILLTDKIITEVLKSDGNSETKWDYLMMKYPETINYIDVDEGFYSVISYCYDNVVNMYDRQNKNYPDSNDIVLNRYGDATITQYSYCEIHESLIMGIIAANIPFPDHNQGPRNIFQYAQGRQAMGIYNYRNRTDISYILYNTQRSIVSSRLARYVHTDILPCGENCVVLLACYTGHGQEDAMIFNKGSIDRGLFRSISLRKWESKIEKNQSTSQDEIFKKPDENIVMIGTTANYDKLNDDAFVPEETPVEDGDAIIGKITPIQQTGNMTKPFKDSSKIYKHNEKAIVDKVFNNVIDADGYEMKKIRTRAEEVPMIGDKFCLKKDVCEVLTDRGWLKIKDITLDDKIATLVDGHKLVYDYPTGIYEFNYKGKMYKVCSQEVDLDVTIDHKMYAKKSDNNEFELYPASEIVGKKYKLKKNWINKNYDEHKLYEIKQSQYQYFTTLFDSYVKSSNQNVYNEIFNYINNLESPELELLCKHIFNDVNKYELNHNNNEINKINIITHIIIQSGHSYVIHNDYIKIIYNYCEDNIKYYEPKINECHMQDEIYDYDGLVECLEVPSHVFMVRQNGKNVWTGNCCYTDDHDVLTTEGWVPIDKVTKSHYVATMIETNTLKYTKPIATQEYDYEGKMYQVKSNQVDLFVTPNHRMYVGNKNGENFSIKNAEDCYGKKWTYKKNIENYEPPENKTEFIDYNDYTFKLPGVDDLPELKLNLESWLKFFGIWITEGCTIRDYGLSFVTHKQSVKDELEIVCTEMNFKTQKDKIDNDKKNEMVYSDKRLVEYFKQLSVGAIDKEFPKWIWNLKQNDCKILINGIMIGNDHTIDNENRIYDISSIKLSNDFQRLCLHAGYSTNISVKSKERTVSVEKNETITTLTDAHRLTIIENQNTHLVNKNITQNGENRHDEWIQDYKGKVYCCTVEGDGVIYVRRNNCSVWCGNSKHGQKGTIGLILPQAEMPFTEEGILPDLIINPVGIAGRMTAGQLIECITGKVAAISGKEGNGTCFTKVNIDEICDNLEKLGYNRNGTETVYCGLTGQEFKTKMFIGPTYYQRLKHLVADKMYCLRVDNTEVLTKDGWKKHCQLTLNDEIATLDNNKLVYSKPSDIFYYPNYKGNMYKVKSDNIDLDVTPNHKMWVSENGKDFDFRLAETINSNDEIYYKKDCEWNVEDYKLCLPLTTTKDAVFSSRNIDTHSMIILIGFMIKYKTRINDLKHIEICDMNDNDFNNVSKCLEKLYFNYCKLNTLTIIDEPLINYLHDFVTKNTLPEWIFMLSRKQCLLLFNTIDINNDYIIYNKDFADKLLQLTIHCGLIYNLTTINNESWKLTKVNEDKFNANNYEIYKYTGPVFCVTVPSHVFMVRVDGKACWTGNSRAKGFVTILTHQPPEGYQHSLCRYLKNTCKCYFYCF